MRHAAGSLPARFPPMKQVPNLLKLNALPNLSPGAKAISVPADSAKIEGVEHLVKEVMKTTDHVDILFANAGATWGEAFDTHPDSAFAKVMDLNVKSVFNTIRL